jgi:hypothetical protein
MNVVRNQQFCGNADFALQVSGGQHVFEGCSFSAEQFDRLVLVRDAEVSFLDCQFLASSNRGLVAERSRLVVERCAFIGNRVAFWATDGTVAALTDCTVVGPGSAGLFFQKGASGQVVRCTVEDVDDGAVVVRSGATPIFEGCRFACHGTAVHYEPGGAGELRDCEVHGKVTGIWVNEGGAPRVLSCKVFGASSVGLAVRGGGRFERCWLERNAIGVFIQDGGDPTVVDCDAVGGETLGLCALGGARGIVEGCRFGPHPAGATLLMPGAETQVR